MQTKNTRKRENGGDEVRVISTKNKGKNKANMKRKEKVGHNR